MAVTTAQHLRDKAPLIRKSEGWLSKKAIRSYQCSMIHTKDGNRAWDSLARGAGLEEEKHTAGRK